MDYLSFKDITGFFESHSINSYKVYCEREDVVIYDYGTFCALLNDLGVNVVLYDLNILDESEIENNLITDEDLNYNLEYVNSNKQIKEKIKDYNNALKQLEKHVGKEQVISLYFQNEGIIYTYHHRNSMLLFEDKDDFLEMLFVEHNEEIEEAKEENYNRKKSDSEVKLNKLYDFLIDNNDFKKCTNSPSRRGFVYDLLRSGSNFDLSNVNSRLINNTVEDAWRKIKLNKALNSDEM